MITEKTLIALSTQYMCGVWKNSEIGKWQFSVGPSYVSPGCRDEQELRVALECARLGGNAHILAGRERDTNWIREWDALCLRSAELAADAHEAHTELHSVLRELARARAEVLRLEQDLRLVQCLGAEEA